MSFRNFILQSHLIAWVSLILVTSTCRAQGPVDRAVMNQSLRDGLAPLNRSNDQQETSMQEAAPDEIDVLDREFGLQSVSGFVPVDREQLFLTLEASGFFSSNTTLSPDAEVAGWVGRPGLRGGWFPRLGNDLDLLATISHSLWRYADQPQLDFDDFGGQIGLQHHLGRWELPGGVSRLHSWAQYRYQRLHEPWNWGARFYENHFIEAGFRKGWRLAPKISAWLGGSAAFSVAGGPADFLRHEHGAQTGAVWQATPQMSLTALYRVSFFDHTKVSREDINHQWFLGVNWQVMRHLGLQLFVNGVVNRSNVNAFDHHVLNTGLNVSIAREW